jgi:DNA-binding beta-propeller fold protein YncE
MHDATDVGHRGRQTIDTVPTLQGPKRIGYDPGNGNVYVASDAPGRVSVITLSPRDR